MVDLGTGDGRYVLATARADRDSFVLGVDASAAGMVEASRRASRDAGRGGLPNARFVVAAAERIGTDLPAFADRVTINFPWGSLLRGLVVADARLLASLSAHARPGATVEMLLSVADRDHGTGLPPLDQHVLSGLARPYAAHGLRLLEARLATQADIASAHSSWARRLGAGARRATWLLRFRRWGEPRASRILCRVREVTDVSDR